MTVSNILNTSNIKKYITVITLTVISSSIDN